VNDWLAGDQADRAPVLSGEASAAYRELFGYAVAAAPELEDALGALATVRLAPGLTTVGTLARACEQVHGWADTHGLAETALQFAELWGRLDEENPIASNLAGRAARKAAQVTRAEVWFERAYRLAARYKNRREMIRALIGHGGLLRERGRYGEARSRFFDAARLAQSTRRHRQAAEVQHELLTIAVETGSFAEAEQYMRAALREYPVHHRALPWLGHDWAFFLVREGLYNEARVLLQAIRQHITRRDLLVVVEGTLGRTLATNVLVEWCRCRPCTKNTRRPLSPIWRRAHSFSMSGMQASEWQSVRFRLHACVSKAMWNAVRPKSSWLYESDALHSAKPRLQT
jgi:tetratricopeptide (TPR) repeat protein